MTETTGEMMRALDGALRAGVPSVEAWRRYGRPLGLSLESVAMRRLSLRAKVKRPCPVAEEER